MCANAPNATQWLWPKGEPFPAFDIQPMQTEDVSAEDAVSWLQRLSSEEAP